MRPLINTKCRQSRCEGAFGPALLVVSVHARRDDERKNVLVSFYREVLYSKVTVDSTLPRYNGEEEQDRGAERRGGERDPVPEVVCG